MKEIANGLKQQLSLSGSYIYLTYKFHGKMSIERFKRKTSVVRAVHGKVGSSYAWFVVILQLVYTIYIIHRPHMSEKERNITEDRRFRLFTIPRTHYMLKYVTYQQGVKIIKKYYGMYILYFGLRDKIKHSNSLRFKVKHYLTLSLFFS